MKSLKFINFSLNLIVYKYYIFIVIKLFFYLKKNLKLRYLIYRKWGFWIEGDFNFYFYFVNNGVKMVEVVYGFFLCNGYFLLLVLEWDLVNWSIY